MTFGGGRGLTEVPTKDLERALRYVHRGDLPVPLEPHGVAACGLQHVLEPLLGHLRGLRDPAAVRAVLVAVIAERRELERAKGSVL
ncbi:MAG: hypothetical protein ACQEXJ_05095 [Myxococcota bacterium]